MPVANKQEVLVLGATGAQGSSVVDALLKDGKWSVRILTRNAESQKSKELANKGVTVIQGDMTIKEDLTKAMKGVYGVFALTAFWDPSSMGKEVSLGKLQVDVAKSSGVKHFIWSSLANVAKISKNKYDVPHFTDKAIVEEYARQSGLLSTFVAPAFYFQNFASFFPPKNENGTLVFSLPIPEDRFLTAYDVSDIGPAVVNIFNNPQEWKDKFVALPGEHSHPKEYVETFTRVTGIPAKYNYIPTEVFAKFPFPGAKELAEMFGWFNEFTYYGPHHDLSVGKKANPNLKSWEQWLKQSGWRGNQ